MSSRPSILRRALDYYSKKLMEASEDENINADVILKEELITKMENVKQVSSDIGNLGGSFDIMKNGIQYREVICDALNYYIRDLKKSQNLIQKRFEGTHERFSKLHQEIEAVELVEADVCRIYHRE